MNPFLKSLFSALASAGVGALVMYSQGVNGKQAAIAGGIGALTGVVNLFVPPPSSPGVPAAK